MDEHSFGLFNLVCLQVLQFLQPEFRSPGQFDALELLDPGTEDCFAYRVVVPYISKPQLCHRGLSFQAKDRAALRHIFPVCHVLSPARCRTHRAPSESPAPIAGREALRLEAVLGWSVAKPLGAVQEGCRC